MRRSCSCCSACGIASGWTSASARTTTTACSTARPARPDRAQARRAVVRSLSRRRVAAFTVEPVGSCGVQVDDYLVAVGDRAGEQRPGQVIADRRLNKSPQRTRSIQRVVSIDGEPFASSRTDLKREAPTREPRLQCSDLNVDDRRRSSVVSASKTTMSSRRLRNSGLKCPRTTAITPPASIRHGRSAMKPNRGSR